jgi:glycosyltransferase involved in cell wall biosynthesis
MYAQPSSTRSPEHVRILLCTRNGRPWLQAQLDSYLAQTYTAWSLWISDDGSQDGTMELVADFAARNPGRVERILEGPKQGSSANYLHLLCHPDLPSGIVALSDQDDVWMPEKLETAVRQLDNARGAPCAWSARYLYSDEGLEGKRSSPRWPKPPSLGNAVVQNILSGHTLTLNTEAHDLVRTAGPQPVPHHDWWIYLLLAATGADIYCDPTVVLRFRQHRNNALGASTGWRARGVRVLALLDGTVHTWVEANLQALAKVPVPLTPEACRLLELWFLPRGRRLRMLHRCGVHRQSRAETMLIYLAAALGRL